MIAATSVAGLAVLEYAGPTVVWLLVASIAAVSTVVTSPLPAPTPADPVVQ